MWPDTLIRLLLILILLYLAWVDLRTFMLPNRITYPLIALGLFINSVTPYALTETYLAWLGALLGYLFLYLVNCLYRYLRQQDGLGMGDAKLFAALGAWLGVMHLPFILLYSAVLGLIGGFLWLRYQKLPSTHAFPFGPYLVIAGIIEILWLSPFIRSST